MKVKKPRLISSKRGVVLKGQWKPVNLDPGLFADDGLDGLVCFEELTEYSLVEPEKALTVQQPADTTSKAKKKRKAEEQPVEEDVKEKPGRKKKKKKLEEPQDVSVLDEMVDAKESLTPDTQHTPSQKRKKKKKKKQPAGPPPSQKQRRNWSRSAEGASADVSAWKDLFVPEPVLTALSALGFSAPTPIQALALPPAIRDRLDILGAAETGTRPLTTY